MAAWPIGYGPDQEHLLMNADGIKRLLQVMTVAWFVLGGLASADAAPVRITFDHTSGSATTAAAVIGSGLGNNPTLTDTATLDSLTAIAPLPASMWLLASAIGSLIYFRRRQIGEQDSAP